MAANHTSDPDVTIDYSTMRKLPKIVDNLFYVKIKSTDERSVKAR